MKFCPTCHRQYEDETIKFCLEDGSLLVSGSARGSAEATLHMPGPTLQSSRATPTSPPSTMTPIGYQPPAASMSASVAERTDSRRSPLLWIVIALIIGGSGIAIALIVTRGRDGSSPGSSNSNQVPSPTPGLNSTESSSSNTESSASPKPADTSQTSRQTEKPTSPTTTEAASAKPPKIDARDAAPSPPLPAPRAPVSGGVMNGKAVRLLQPTYPAIARSANASGQVRVQVLIDESGNVISAHAVSGHPLLQASAVSAARASKFSPTMLGGQPVKVNGVIIYNFVAQ